MESATSTAGTEGPNQDTSDADSMSWVVAALLHASGPDWMESLHSINCRNRESEGAQINSEVFLLELVSRAVAECVQN